MDTTVPDPETTIQEGRDYLNEFLRKNGKSTWADLTMAGKSSAAFYVAKKILSKNTDGMDDFKWSAKNDYFGSGVTVYLDKIQYVPTYHGTKNFVIKAYIYFNGNGEIDPKNSKFI